MAHFGLSRKQISMLVVLMFGTFVTVLNQTVVTPALPKVMAEFGVDASAAQWLTTGFTLVNAIMIPITAYLTDRYSTRSLFVVSMGTFTAGSLMAALSPNFGVLLAGRLIQAAGAGILMPMVMTVLLLTFPVEKRGTAMGLFGLIIAFAPAIGPTIAGLVIDNASWHDMFMAITVLCAIVIVSALFAVERIPAQKSGLTLDKLSVVESSVGFGALLYGFSAIGSAGIGVAAIASMAVGAVVLVLFFRRQLHLEKPMLNVRVLQNRTFLVGTIIGMLVQASLLAAGILVPIYLQNLLGYSATTSGLVILPGAIVMGAMGPIAGRLFDRRGPRVLAIVGMTVLTASTFAFAFLGDSTGVVYLTILYTVRLFSLSLVNMPITTWALNSLDDEMMNHGNAVNNTFRQVAGSLGTAVLVSVMSFGTNASAATTDMLHASIFGINLAFGVGAMLCLAGLVLTFLYVRTKSAAKEVESRGEIERRSVLNQLMKRDVFTLPADATVVDAMRLLVEKGISAAPLVDAQGRAVGFVSDGDIMRFLSKRSQMFIDPVLMIMRTGGDDAKFDDRLRGLMQMDVRDIATKGIIGVSADADLSEVCRVLGENHLKKVPVMEDDRLIGVINRSDITQYSMAEYLKAQGAA